MFKRKRKVKLPITLVEFDALVDKVMLTFTLTDKTHASAIISNAIRHLPNDEIYTTLEYLGHTVLKNISNYVCSHKSDSLKHSAQIQSLVSILTSNPLDTQARDQLQLAAANGSIEAKNALEKLILEENETAPAEALVN